jgi:gamma-glutamyltranspeptidase/glutathione hydrolase
MRASVAAGHPATAEAGLAILADGGSAADAAVAASLASCVAETVMTGLLGGGHALYYDAATGQVRHLDCFVAAPSGSGVPMTDLELPFGEQTVRYAVGPASCAVPGLPAGLDALWREHGRLPWARVVEPAVCLARSGVDLPPRHADCLVMLAPVMTMNEGAAIYAPGGRLLQAGELLAQPGLVTALELVQEEGPRSAYEGSIAERLLVLVAERGSAITRADLAAYRARWHDPVAVGYCGAHCHTRGGLSRVPAALGCLPRLAPLSETARVLALLDAVDPRGPESHTTNLVTVDADGSACVLTTSLGLGSGDFLPGLDLHLNSMLGEHDLLVEPLRPGDRVGSMMAPSILLDGGGVVLAAGSAGGTRLATAMVGVISGILDLRLQPQDAVDRPRVHRQAGIVSAEPGVDDDALALLERDGFEVRRFDDIHHYFGGVSLVSRWGPAADVRRSGDVRLL